MLLCGLWSFQKVLVNGVCFPAPFGITRLLKSILQFPGLVMPLRGILKNIYNYVRIYLIHLNNLILVAILL